MQKIKERLKNKKGFTLVEMIVVLAIIGILIALIAPNMARIIQDGQETSDTAKSKTALTAAQAYGTRQISNGRTITPGTAGGTNPIVPIGTAGYVFELNDKNMVDIFGGAGAGSESFMTSSGDSYLNTNIVKGNDKLYVYMSPEGAAMGMVYVNSNKVKSVAGFAPAGVLATGVEFTTGDLKNGSFNPADGKITAPAGTTPPTT